MRFFIFVFYDTHEGVLFYIYGGIKALHAAFYPESYAMLFRWRVFVVDCDSQVFDAGMIFGVELFSGEISLNTAVRDIRFAVARKSQLILKSAVAGIDVCP